MLQTVFLFLYSLALIFSHTIIFPEIKFSTKHSEMRLGENSSIVASTPLTGVNGSIVLESGATLSGAIVSFDANGSLSHSDSTGIKIDGSFDLDTTTVPLSEINFGANLLDLKGGNTVSLGSTVTLQNTWNFEGDTVINGHGNIFDMRDPSAKIVIRPNSSLLLTNIILLDINENKFVFDDTSGPTNAGTLRLTDATIGLDDNITFSHGNVLVEGDSTLILNDLGIIFTDDATFNLQGGTVWLDTREHRNLPVFGEILPAGTTVTTFVDNSTVRVRTDKASHPSDPGVTTLVSGDPFGTVAIESSDTLDPNDQITINEDVEIEGGGTSLTFTGDEPQLVVEEGFTATFGDIELLRISNNTFLFEDNSTVRFKDNVVLEVVEDLTFDRGTFAIIGAGSQVLVRGLGGKKKITFKENSDGSSGGFNLGTSSLVLEDVELVGLEHFSRETKNIGGTVFEGKLVLSAQSRVRMKQDTDMHFLIRGENNKIIFDNNNLTLNGKIKFDNFYDSSLRFGFNIENVNDEYSINLDKDAISLFCEDGRCGVIFDDDRVTLINKSSTSMTAKGSSFIGGETIKIKENPILQQTDRFFFESDVNLISEDLPNPIELSIFDETDKSVKYFTKQDSPFRGHSTKAILIPRPKMIVKNSLSARGLRGTIAVRPNASITSFQPHPTEFLNLILEGNATIYTQSRRVGKTPQIVKEITTIATSDETDALKNGDTIYVTGTNNVIIVTGFFDIKGNIVMDEGAELIFQFDDSVDTEKGVVFGSTSGPFGMDLPPTASIIFKGIGTVFFRNRSKINCLGDAPETLNSVSDTLYEDNRPNVIFAEHAKLSLEDNTELTLSGKGKAIFKDNAEVRITDGQFTIGDQESDIFDLLVDRSSAIQIGSVGSTTYTAVDRPARMSLPEGAYNVKFDRNSSLTIRNGGIFETASLKGIHLNGYVASWLFDRSSKISLTFDGMLGFGQTDLSGTASSNAEFAWDNTDGLIEGDGIIAVFGNASTEPLLQAQLQAQTLASTAVSPLGLVKSLSKTTSALINASDYFDKVDGLRKLITPNNVVVTLQDDDVIRREGPDSGNVYGTDGVGRRFAVFPDGTRQTFGV